ncbi:hypothetical protein JXE04_01995 [Patescibacteria group bacterium]|nr:hypothetical protein [Patescibacteria group bacterium]
MSLKIINFLKKYKPVLLVVLVFALSFIVAPQALAGVSDWAGEVVGGIIYVFIWTLGLVLILVIKGLLLVATYQNFISSGAVIEGWVVVRDLANMFFVVILLIIAFATILHLEEYNYKKWLPKLILMAILINFSKTICGLLIDVAQIIMLTFVNAFKDVAGGNLIDMLGIKSIVTLAKGNDDVGFWAIVGAYILGLIYMIVALVVITTMMMVLAMRIVMIWIYVVLSPLAYLLSAFPGGAKYASEWWSEFIKNLIVGPVLAFFIWLSFAALQTGTYSDTAQIVGSSASSTAEQTAFANSIATTNREKEKITEKPPMVTEASTPGVLIKFIIGIGMLLGGLKISQQIGGAAGAVAGKGMSKLSSMGATTAGFVGGAAISTTHWAGRKLDQGQMALQRKAGIQRARSFNPVLMKKGWQASREEAKEKYYSKSNGANAWHDTFNKYSDIKQYGSIRKGKKSMSKDLGKANKLRLSKNQDESDLDILERRKGYLDLSESQRVSKIDELADNRDSIIAEYVKKDNRDVDDAEKLSTAENNFREDMKVLTPSTDDNVKRASIVSQINAKQTDVANQEKEISSLEDVRRSLGGIKLGFSSSHMYDPVYSKMGNDEYQEKKQKEMSARTNEDTFALTTELIKAYKEKDTVGVASALKLLSKNNDLNSALQDDRVSSIMTAKGGILETLAEKDVLGEDGKQNINSIKKDYNSNRVSPAYIQALVQGSLLKTGVNSDLAGRYANDVGLINFASGNGGAYGIANGDVASGEYKFSDIHFDVDTGGLETSTTRIDETVGKFATMESQSKMRAIHPDTILKQNKYGEATGLSGLGEAMLKSLNGHDLGQISRLRTDLVNKFGKSDQAMKDAIALIKKLEASGSDIEKAQASNIKYFVGYIQSKKSSGGDSKDAAKIEQAYKDLEKKFNA